MAANAAAAERRTIDLEHTDRQMIAMEEASHKFNTDAGTVKHAFCVRKWKLYGAVAVLIAIALALLIWRLS